MELYLEKESAILKFRAINIRDNHERPEAMEETSVILTGTNSDRIIQSIELIKNQKVDHILIDVEDYAADNISIKIERLLLSYTDYINKKVWRKRILVYTNHYYPENFKINDVVRWLKDDNHHIRVITQIPNYPNGDFYKGYGVFKI